MMTLTLPLASRREKYQADVMFVMMLDVTVEAAMIQMERKINFLMKVIDEWDNKITVLREQMQTREIIESSQTPVVKDWRQREEWVQVNQPQQQ